MVNSNFYFKSIIEDKLNSMLIASETVRFHYNFESCSSSKTLEERFFVFGVLSFSIRMALDCLILRLCFNYCQKSLKQNFLPQFIFSYFYFFRYNLMVNLNSGIVLFFIQQANNLLSFFYLLNFENPNFLSNTIYLRTFRMILKILMMLKNSQF